MAINIPIVTEFNQKGLQDAQNAFSNFRTKINEADGAMGKLKAGFGASVDAIKANAGMLASAAGAAIAGFAIKAINDFKDLALEVDKFRDATGLTLDESSRWIEVAGDIDIQAETIQKAIGKMERAAGTSLKPFQDLGIEIAKFADGRMNPHETFLRVVDALDKMEDPAKRARVASQLLGKSWEELAPLISMGANDIKTALAGVSDQKIIDEEEVRKAEEFRATMDTLNDVFQDVVLELGESLIPLLGKLVDKFLPLISIVGDSVEAIAGPQDGLTKAIIDMGGNINDVVENLGFETVMKDMGLSASELAKLIRKDLVPETYNLQFAWQEGYRAMIDADRALGDLDQSLGDVSEEYDKLIGKLDDRQAWRNLVNDVKEAGDKADEAFAKKMPNALGISMDSLDDAKRSLADYIAETDNIPAEKKTLYLSQLDQASWQQVRSMLDALAIARAVPYQPVLSPGFGGGPVEQGSGGRPIGSSPINRMSLMSMPTTSTAVNVTVQGSVTTEADLLESIRKGLVNAQRNGAGLVYSNQ